MVGRVPVPQKPMAMEEIWSNYPKQIFIKFVFLLRFLNSFVEFWV